MSREKFSDHLRPGWLKRQCLKTEEEALKWPDWMLEESGMQDIIEKKKRVVKAKQKRVIRSIKDFLKLYLPKHYNFLIKERDYQEMIEKIKKEII